MSCELSLSLSTLPIGLVYRILSHLKQYDIFISATNVCVRLNSIIDTYQPYQVKLSCFFKILQLYITLKRIVTRYG